MAVETMHSQNNTISGEEDSLDEEAYYIARLKCGEVFLMEDEWKILFKCSVCAMESPNLDYFLMHSLDHHLSVNTDGVEMLVDQTGGENGLKRHPVDVDQKYAIHSKDDVDAAVCDRFDLHENDEDSTNETTPLNDASGAGSGNESSAGEEMNGISENETPTAPATEKTKNPRTGNYTCEVCDQQFKIRNRYEVHMRRHNGIKPYTCEYCGAKFVDSSNYNTHRHRHLGIKPHKCDMCSKRFTSTTDLKFHRRSHTGERPHSCPQCERSFKSMALLNAHIRRHTNERPFICATCGKGFFDRQLLRYHEVSHTNERPHGCTECDMKFNRRSALMQHRKLHSGTLEYKCEICSKGFRQNAGLHAHKKSQHRQ